MNIKKLREELAKIKEIEAIRKKNTAHLKFITSFTEIIKVVEAYLLWAHDIEPERKKK
jgi:hypothetical protein